MADPVDGDADDADDGRERPKYEFLYKQAVGTQDTILGSGDKDPSSTRRGEGSSRKGFFWGGGGRAALCGAPALVRLGP